MIEKFLVKNGIAFVVWAGNALKKALTLYGRFGYCWVNRLEGRFSLTLDYPTHIPNGMIRSPLYGVTISTPEFPGVILSKSNSIRTAAAEVTK